MKKIKELWKNKRKYFYIGGAILILVIILSVRSSGKGKNGTEEYTVERKDVVQSVVLSGKVEFADQADLGFAAAGRVGRVLVKNNERVTNGQILAQLEIGDLLADLSIKEANSTTSDIDLEAAKEELANVTAGENTKVDSAYRAMLSDDLSLIPRSSSYTVGEPAISGNYGGTEGQYKIRIMQKEGSFTDFEILTFGLEVTRREINKTGPTPLGARGLFVTFGDAISDYKETTWYLDIPNKSGASYVANLSAYEEVQDARDIRIKNAQAEYDKLLAEDRSGGASVAEAEIEKIRAEIRKNSIYAPFPGRVTNIEKEVGESASVGERVISVLGEEKLQVVLEVPELDVAKLSPGSLITIKLDAFPGEEFAGTLETINSRETEIDGVPVYEAFVALASDARVKTGMSATGTIVLNEKKDVLGVPGYLVKEENGKNFVEVLLPDGKTEMREVELGLKGSDNMTEVIGGVSAGEKVLAPKE